MNGLQTGLEAFARADYRAAADAWLRALHATPADKTVKQYLDHLRNIAGAVVTEVENELALSPAPSVAPAPAPAPAPRSAPVFALDVPEELPPMLPYVADEEPAPVTPLAPPSSPAATAFAAALAAAADDEASADPWGSDPTDVVASGGPGLTFVAAADSRVAHRDVSSLVAQMREAAELDDFSRSLPLAESVLAAHPGDADARRVRDRARERLHHMYVSALGSLDAIPRVLVQNDQIVWLDLDQRAGFVLAQVDGVSSYHDIIAVTAMDELETLEILARLARERVIGG